jgi:hypothetical protein
LILEELVSIPVRRIVRFIMTVTLLSLGSGPLLPSVSAPGTAVETGFSRIAPAHETSANSIDLFGDDVVSAVATYKIDPTGAIYEEHSPNTEIAHLGEPTS